MKTAFVPIVDNNSRILILGTMPGERSLQLQQYYGHSANQFWRIMFRLFDKSFTKDYELRKQLLIDNGVALWDVLQNCEGEGSSDSNIINEVPNNFDLFYQQHPQIEKVYFASKAAEKYYDKYVGKRNDIIYHSLPSPSSANTWKTFEEKLGEWMVIVESKGLV